MSQVAREHRLRTALDEYLRNLQERLDFVLIDCPPSLGLLTINAFAAAQELLIPIQCEYYALEGLSQLLGTVRMIQKHLNPGLRLSTILLTMYDGRTRLAQQVAEEVRQHFPNEVLDNRDSAVCAGLGGAELRTDRHRLRWAFGRRHRVSRSGRRDHPSRQCGCHRERPRAHPHTRE